ncbi:dynein-associated roadblock protein-like protein [Leishmania tarentolae]|uniref:Dynein-associated roadblock protein-like protein n=1 Tax=Leishmania tarentolae TaxID=5689 RepID=A0A640KTT1_LEITA|nr:dynein-associated roadblock protein-like protein [Leishmania tarentolae]
MKSLSGATMISFFLERMRRKHKSFVGSKSRTQCRALAASDVIRWAYWFCTVVSSIVLRMGVPSLSTTMMPVTLGRWLMR